MFSFFENILSLTGLPANVFNNSFKVINFCNNAVYIECYKTILSFSTTEISIKLPQGLAKITGNSLKIKNMDISSILITGKISLLEVS